MNKAEFLQALQAERARLEARLASLTEGQLTERPSPDAWSLKDTLAHLTYWEQFMLSNIRRAVERGETPQWMDGEEETATNARVFADHRDRLLLEVLGDLRHSFEQLLQTVEALSEADLTDPRRFAWLNGEPLWTYIANEAYAEHLIEHLEHTPAWQ